MICRSSEEYEYEEEEEEYYQKRSKSTEYVRMYVCAVSVE